MHRIFVILFIILNLSSLMASGTPKPGDSDFPIPVIVESSPCLTLVNNDCIISQIDNIDERLRSLQGLKDAPKERSRLISTFAMELNTIVPTAKGLPLLDDDEYKARVRTTFANLLELMRWFSDHIDQCLFTEDSAKSIAFYQKIKDPLLRNIQDIDEELQNISQEYTGEPVDPPWPLGELISRTAPVFGANVSTNPRAVAQYKRQFPARLKDIENSRERMEAAFCALIVMHLATISVKPLEEVTHETHNWYIASSCFKHIDELIAAKYFDGNYTYKAYQFRLIYAFFELIQDRLLDGIAVYPARHFTDLYSIYIRKFCKMLDDFQPREPYKK